MAVDMRLDAVEIAAETSGHAVVVSGSTATDPGDQVRERPSDEGRLVHQVELVRSEAEAVDVILGTDDGLEQLRDLPCGQAFDRGHFGLVLLGMPER